MRPWALLAILLLALLLRLIGLESNPPGFFRDEARKAYSTYSLLKTGKDLTGRDWPLQIKEFNAYTTPIYHWLSLPILGTLGMSVFAARLSAALAGTLACWGVYLLGRDWVSRNAGLWAAALLAVSPWHLLFSRWANQGILMTAFIPLALWLTWRALEGGQSPRWRWAIPSAVFWALSWIAYEPARVFVPALLFTLIFLSLFREGWRSRQALVVFGIGMGTLLLISPFVVAILRDWELARARFETISGQETLTPLLLLKNYLLHWNPLYLLWSGDANPRHHVSGQGQLAPLEGLACLAGVYLLWKTKGAWRGMLLAWLLLSPLPGSITQEGLPHSLRTLMIVPAFALLGGIALAEAAKCAPNLPKQVVAAALIAAWGLQACVSLYLFRTVYPEKSAPYWEAGYLEAIRSVEANRKEGEVCAVSGLIEFPEAMVEFVTLPDPTDIQSGKPLGGYRFEKTGTPLNPLAYSDCKLFLIRPGEIRRPPWWKELSPAPENEEMLSAWRLYRSEK
ncbi:MAG: glycosyltransferase family 39 protein [Candidatus Omnitrophica bacterium]|nr:glycosyltransferase family 39 protein [Candidatus Omnitrophota bacterium]